MSLEYQQHANVDPKDLSVSDDIATIRHDEETLAEVQTWRHTHGANPEGYRVCFACMARQLADAELCVRCTPERDHNGVLCRSCANRELADTREALVRIERMSGAAGYGETPAWPLAKIARAALSAGRAAS